MFLRLPLSGLENMDPRKFIRMAMLGMDEELSRTPWGPDVYPMQTLPTRVPDGIHISQLVFHARETGPKSLNPQASERSCELTRSNARNKSAMGIPPDDFEFVEMLLLKFENNSSLFKDLCAPIEKGGNSFPVNQNSREPMSEPEEMVLSGRFFISSVTGPMLQKAGQQKASAAFQAMR